MDKSAKFIENREKYKTFYYNSYSLTEDAEALYIQYDFEIPELTKFNPSIKIMKKNIKFKDINTEAAHNMVFHIGLIELISYWKCTCSPQVIIKCGKLNEEQIKWWKKLYYYGLGELFYSNNIKTTIEDFMDIKCESEKVFSTEFSENEETSGYIIPIGGGKDSVVTLETLKLNKKKDYCLIINPKTVTVECAKIAGFEDENIIEVHRIIDQRLIELNKQDFINGHTPFSAMLAFVSYFIGYMLSKKYIALSNENSANESNVIGSKINHQYSKSFEFEKDFADYTEKYLKQPIKYFSFLRPLNELQIAKIFAKQVKYHKVFRSCNVGSKETEWKWCCNCAKCLFAYIILSPYLYKQNLIDIFGEDMFEKQEMLQTFIELIGKGEIKPFDCVGTFEEVNFAISKTIENIEKENGKLPYLLKYYKDNYDLVDTSDDITKRYNEENSLNEEQNRILRKEVLGID